MTDFSYQLYSSRHHPLSDTLKMLGELGYTQVEGYGGLFAEADVGDLKAELDGNGLTMPTGHFSLEMVRDEPGRVLEIATVLGMKGVFVPAVGPEERVKDAAGWAELGRVLARIGKPVQDAGLTFGWHNHAFEFAEIDSAETPLDLILQGGPLALEFDVAWAVVGGQDPLDWIEKYGDRLYAAHIKDIAPDGECEDEDGWADVGHGTMDWPTIMTALRRTPCQYFVMEHDNPSDPARFARRSLAAAKTL
ncbi:sugar phosphate isomerase/epimerase family protein [Psychromarinibacter halotolerans]|uniref:Sugar phosphate isomerase/epimerase family protein n=1 Tax=Psychromarinibacter halotolerans TaxID=1775175 RepID=A0ABV7GV11_9RHOB|nr:sugar phosphate isomerase/epimerase [Psychromarinibacter halotolerans]MDF0596226.1 sugar phosphate isomerase/epimerase [Psychromarinibacter halotolerans]